MKTREFVAGSIDDAPALPQAAPNDPLASMIASDLGRHVADALNALTAKQRQVFLGVHDRGESYAEVAQAMNLSRETVKKYLARANQLMRNAVARYEGSQDQ